MAKALETDSWLSAREARELVFYFIRWGQHMDDYLRPLPDDTVEAELQQRGYDLNDEVSKLQKNPHRAIKWFENLLIGGTWEIEASPGPKITHSVLVDGIEISKKEVNEHAVLRQAHTSDFLAACNARDEAIRIRSFDSFYTAISKGFSSIEAYLALRVHVYNAKCSDPNKILNERRKKGGFVTLDKKIKDWLPIMTNVTLDVDKSLGWEDYKFLRSIRNDVVIHPKPGAGFTKIEELADGLNRFRYGIGALMFLLHKAFNEPMQSSIIRAMRYPTVRVIQK
ncbi:MAG: hypothetical protein JSR32_00125 [Proteobacteria bacterium]|nr:hypothetical protein [Pseudomonadota bacterium]